MGIKQLLIDSQIQGFWYGHIKQGQTDAGQGGGRGRPRRRVRDASLQRHVRQSSRWLSALDGHSNDPMGR